MQRLLICLYFLFTLFAAGAKSDTLQIPLIGGQQLPPNTRILYFGDSQTSFSYKRTGNWVQYQNYGYVGWVAAMSPGVQMPPDGVLAVPGETTSQMVNRLHSLDSFDAKILVVLAGTNDPLYAIPPETTKANLRRVYDAALARGMQVIAITILPRFAQNTYSPPVEANRRAINEWIKQQTNVIPLDVENDLNGPEFFEDGLHTSPLGAYALATRVSAVVNHLVAQCTVGSGSVAQLSVSPNSNPLMAGTGGRVSNANGASNASGIVANNWQLIGNFAGTAAVAGSKDTDANGRDQQVITISGNYTGNSRRVTFNNAVNTPVNLQSGNLIEGVAEVDIPVAMTGVRSVYLRFQAYSTDYASTLAEGYSMFPTSSKPLNIPPGKYLLRTPPVTISAGGPVWQLTTQIVIEFYNTTTTDPVSAVVKVNSAGIRKLPLADGPQAFIQPAGTQPFCPGDALQLAASAGNSYAYQWYRNGTALADSTAQKLWVSDTGRYTVAVKQPGCEVISRVALIEPGDCPQYTLTIDSLPAQLCAGQTFAVPYRVSDAFAAGNVFSVQLSDGSGSFENALVIGSITATGDSTIQVVLPAALPADSGYRVRIVASLPADTVLYPAALMVKPRPVAAILPADSVDAWPNLAASLKASPAEGFQHQWLRNGEAITPNGTDSIFLTTQPGDYRVVVTAASSCTDTSAVTVVRLRNCEDLRVFLSAADSSLTIDSVLGGLQPYQFSLDSVTFQATPVFRGLTPGHTYTVFVTDSVHCTGKASFTLPLPILRLAAPFVSPGLCKEQASSIGYNVSGAFGEANRFYLQLSTADGSFAAPQLLDSVTSLAAGTLQVRLPDTLTTGEGYRLRVVSTQPEMISDTSAAFRVGAAPAAVITPSDTVTVYPSFPALLTAAPQGDYTYQWLRNGSAIAEQDTTDTYSATQDGHYAVVVIANPGCADTSATVYVNLVACTEISIAVSSQDSSVYVASVNGGFPPYLYSIDSVQFQQEPLFTGLVPGQDYTIYVKDSVNCMGRLAFTVRPPVDFEPQRVTSGKGATFTPQKLGNKPGIVVVTYDMQSVPDKMDIYYNGANVVTTPGYVTDKGWLWFDYLPLPGGPYYCNIRMLAEQGGAEWMYRALTPISQYQVMRQGADTTNAAVLVSPGFPNGYPANSSSVFTFTPATSGGKLRADFKALLLNPTDVLTVYDGPSTGDSVLGEFSGANNILQTPLLLATNATGQLTFRFVSGDTAGRYGWIADVHTVSTIRSFYPQKAASGDTVTILGSGFTGAYAVRFGSVVARSFDVLSDTLVKAVVGNGTSGDVEIMSPGGLASLPGFVFNNEQVLCPVGVYSLPAGVTGSTYQWQLSTDSTHFVNLTDTDLYSGSNSSALQLTNLPTSAYGYVFRCMVDSTVSRTYTVRFVSTWTGATDENWETPSNWSCGVVPDENTDVMIGAGNVKVNGNTTVRTLQLTPGSQLTLAAEVQLNIRK